MKKRFLSLVLCLAAVLALLVPSAGAANVCQEEDIKGDTSRTVEFYVTTGSKWKLWGDSVKLTQTMGRLTYDVWSGDKTTDEYGYFHVRWSKQTDDGFVYVDGREMEGSSKTIPGLKRNTTYKIVVEPYTFKEIGNAHPVRFSAYLALKNSGSMYWESNATWTVSATSKGVNTCSFAK